MTDETPRKFTTRISSDEFDVSFTEPSDEWGGDDIALMMTLVYAIRAVDGNIPRLTCFLAQLVSELVGDFDKTPRGDAESNFLDAACAVIEAWQKYDSDKKRRPANPSPTYTPPSPPPPQ